MPKADGSIIIDTRIDTKGFQSGSVNLQSQFSKLAGAAKKLSLALGGAFALGKIAQFGKEAIELGSDLQEVQNVVDVTFGRLSGQIDEFAKNAITSFGLSELSAKQYASTIGAMLKSMGFATDQAAAMSMEIAGLAGDMASFYNLTGDDAFAKIRSGISGETEPLKQLGINLSVANLEQYALAQGITKTYNAMTEQEKALLRYNYLLSVTSDAQGDFARTSNSWANQTKILSEQFNSLKATIGQGLINVLTPVIKVINTILSGLQAIANAFRQFTELLFGAAGGTAGQIEDVAAGFESAAGGASDLAAGTEKAGKAAKKYLAGFDEITKLGGDGGSGGSGGGGGGVGSVDFGGINLGGTEPVQDNISPQIQAIVDKVHSLLEPLKEIDFSPLRESLQNLGGAFGNLGATIVDGLEWAWFNILVPLGEWTIEEALPAAVDALSDAFDFLDQVLEEISPMLDAVWNSFFKPLAEWAGGVIVDALELIGDTFEQLTKNMEADSRDTSQVIIDEYDETWRQVEMGFVVPTQEEMKTTARLIKEWFTDAGAWISDKFRDAKDAVTEAWGNVSTWFSQNVVTPVSDFFTETWANIKEGASDAWVGIKEVFSSVAEFFGEVFSDAWAKVRDVFSPFGEIFTDIKDGILTAFKEIVNGLISGLNSAIAVPFDGINWALSKIRNVNILGLTPFSNLGSISVPKIPYLAQGAVIPPNAPFMAVLGDQSHGTNIEAPLSTIQEAVAVVMEDMVGGMMAGFEALLEENRRLREVIEEKEIGDEAVYRANKRYTEKINTIRGRV